MGLLNRLIGGLRALIWKTRDERELDDELRAYLYTAIEQKVASGMAREDATRAAQAEMGSVAAIKDNVRDTGWETRIETFIGDVRFALRSLSRRLARPASLRYDGARDRLMQGSVLDRQHHRLHRSTGEHRARGPPPAQGI